MTVVLYYILLLLRTTVFILDYSLNQLSALNKQKNLIKLKKTQKHKGWIRVCACDSWSTTHESQHTHSLWERQEVRGKTGKMTGSHKQSQGIGREAVAAIIEPTRFILCVSVCVCVTKKGNEQR